MCWNGTGTEHTSNLSGEGGKAKEERGERKRKGGRKKEERREEKKEERGRKKRKGGGKKKGKEGSERVNQIIFLLAEYTGTWETPLFPKTL